MIVTSSFPERILSKKSMRPSSKSSSGIAGGSGNGWMPSWAISLRSVATRSAVPPPPPPPQEVVDRMAVRRRGIGRAVFIGGDGEREKALARSLHPRAGKGRWCTNPMLSAPCRGRWCMNRAGSADAPPSCGLGPDSTRGGPTYFDSYTNATPCVAGAPPIFSCSQSSRRWLRQTRHPPRHRR